MFALELPPPRYHEGAFALIFLTLLSLPKCHVKARQWPDLLDGTCATNMPYYFCLCYGGQYRWYQISIYTTWYALYNLQPATIHLKPHSLFSPDAMEGNIKYIISQYTRGDTLYNLQPVTIHLEPHSLLSPDAMEGNIKYIISQYTRGDTPCTTCSRLRFVSNLTHSFLVPWWCQSWYRQAPYMVVRRNAFALCCSAYHNRPIYAVPHAIFFKHVATFGPNLW